MTLSTDTRTRMLVVDDDAEIARSVERLLSRRFQASVEIASDVQEARRHLVSQAIDVVILDYQLPDGSGLQLLNEITGKKNHPPVIMVTGQGDESVASEALRLRVSGYVVKDNRMSARLPEAVANVLNEIALNKAEERLRRSEENERALLNATLQTLVLLDRQGTVLAANETAAKRMKMEPDEITGMNFFEHTPPELARECKETMAEVFNTGAPAHFSDEYKGTYLELVIHPIAGENGEVERVALFAQDMTERRRAEDAVKKARDELEERVRERTSQLAESNRELRAEIAVRQRVEGSLKTLSAQVHGQARMLDQILSSSPDHFYLFDTRGKFIYASEPASKLLGLKQGEVEGRYWWDLGLSEKAMHPLDVMRENVVRTGEQRAGRLHLPTVSGEGEFEYILSPITGWDANVSAVLATMREVTEEELAMDDLRHRAVELEEKARLMDVLPFAIIHRDMNDGIRTWNAGAESLFGWNADEAVGKVAHELLETVFPCPPGEIDFVLLANGCWEGRLTHTSRSGDVVPVISRWTVVIDETGKPGAVLEIDEPIVQDAVSDDSDSPPD